MGREKSKGKVKKQGRSEGKVKMARSEGKVEGR